MSSTTIVTATLILLAGVVDDMRSRKFHNWLFVTLTVCAITFAVLTGGGWMGLNTSLVGFATGLIAFLPLVLIHVVGAGDMKLIAAFGAAVGFSAVLDVAIYSLLWGVIFGLVQIAIKGQLTQLVKNLAAISKMQDRTKLQLHTIPFTVAIFMAWLTHLARNGVLK
jgi:prepilin peptidase CpaA